MIYPQPNILLEYFETHQQVPSTQSFKEQASSSFKNVPILIKCQPEISLFTNQVSSSEKEINLHTVLVRRNGSPYLVPQECREFFSAIIFKSERIDYFLKSNKEYFKLCLDISICLEEPSPIEKVFLIDEIQTILKKSKTYLALAGLIKSESKTSLISIKNSLKLKKEFVQALLEKNHEGEIKRTPKYENSDEVNDIEVVEIEENGTDEIKIRKGGYFIVEEMICKVTKSDGSSSEMVLAKKKIKQNVDCGKMFKELEFVSRIKNKEYFLHYYKTNDQTCFYMNFVPKTLKDFAHQKTFTMFERFDLAHQLIEAISILHESSIVHRLKLENILVETAEEIRLKIIDFGESEFLDKTSKDSKLGCTPPYSPLECILSIEDESFHRPEIDYWSIVVIIYELTFKSLPFYYNQSIQSELVNGWRSEGDFSIFLRYRGRKGFWKIEEMLNLFTEQGLRMRQSERLNLKQMSGVIKAIEGYYERLKELT